MKTIYGAYLESSEKIYKLEGFILRSETAAIATAGKILL